jgi:Caleosin related protein
MCVFSFYFLFPLFDVEACLFNRVNASQTTLQQHILFWDPDEDGQIFPWDVYNGFRQLGFNILFSLLAVLIINASFSYPTRLAYSWFPDPWFRVYVSSVHKAKVRLPQPFFLLAVLSVFFSFFLAE